MEIVFKLGLILLLVVLNGFFVASEFALVAIRKTRVNELVKKGKRRAKLLQKMVRDIDLYISSTQLGITLASLALGWIGEPTLARVLKPLFNFLPDTSAAISAHSISILLAFVLITYLHIVLGEITPKSLSLRRAEKIALIVISPLLLFTSIFKPFIWLLDESGNLILKLLRVDTVHKSSIHSEEEIKMLLAQSSKSGIIPKHEVEIMQNVFRLGDIAIKQIMVPKSDIIAFNQHIPWPEVIEKVGQYPAYSRFPVYGQDIDHINGFIHLKDVYKRLESEADNKPLNKTDLIRKILHVPESQKADKVLSYMRSRRTHIVVVDNPKGGTAGIVTLEDMIEALIGEIEDEFD